MSRQEGLSWALFIFVSSIYVFYRLLFETGKKACFVVNICIYLVFASVLWLACLLYVCRVRLNGFIISNHSAFGHWCSQAQQSDHLRPLGLWPKGSCLSLYVSLALFFCYSSMPLSSKQKNPSSHGHQPLSSLFATSLSFTSMGEKGQGHTDKHTKVKRDKRETHSHTWLKWTFLVDCSLWAAVMRGLLG